MICRIERIKNQYSRNFEERFSGLYVLIITFKKFHSTCENRKINFVFWEVSLLSIIVPGKNSNKRFKKYVSLLKHLGVP